MRRLEFSKSTQEKGQSLTQFATQLRGLWLECDFNNFNPHEWLVTILAHGCRSARQKEKIRDMKDRTWNEIKEAIKQWEADYLEDKSSEHKASHQPHQAQQVQQNGNKKQRKPKKSVPPGAIEGQCWRCTSKNHHGSECKIAKDTVCNNCGKTGHIGKACFKNNIKQQTKRDASKPKARQVEEKSDDHEADISDSEECRAVNSSREVLFS
jgi:hypothetical protein